MAVAYYADWGALAVYFSYAVVKFGTNLALPANDATIIDVTPPAERKFVYTVNYWVINVALGTGALLGAFLYSAHFGAVILGGAIGMAFALTITVTMVAETRPEIPRPPTKLTGLAQFAQGYKVVLADSTFRRLIIAATLILTLEGQLSTAIGIRLSTDFPTQPVFPFGAVTGVEMLGVLKAVNTILVVAFALVVNTLLKRMPDRARLYAGITLYAGGFAVLAVTDDAWLLLVAVVVLTVGELMNLPVQQALLAELAPDDGTAAVPGRVLPPHPVRPDRQLDPDQPGRGGEHAGDGRDLPGLRRRDHPAVPGDPGPARDARRGLRLIPLGR